MTDPVDIYYVCISLPGTQKIITLTVVAKKNNHTNLTNVDKDFVFWLTFSHLGKSLKVLSFFSSCKQLVEMAPSFSH